MTIDSNYNLVADKNYAQILIDTREPSRSFEEAKRIIEANGISIIEIKYLSSGYVLIKLDVTDIRGIILSLIEFGFSDLKGINASRF
jgi:hypothetical protein